MAQESKTDAVGIQQITEEMRSSFIDYAMSVIVARALPDARDGLKPVHRRILYGMSQMNIHYNRPYVKCARVVGDVLGKYHPHGDASVYDALVRMAQEWNLRYPLIDGQGNFGSVEGDSAAAYRYTECRLRRISDSVLADLDKATVDFVPNFDDKEEEPTVLPTLVPNLLVNGASGIAVGMATNIPPHNLGEVLDGVIALAANPSMSLDELMRYIPGPDFPTHGIIYGRQGIRQAYETGRGQLVLRAKAHIEERKQDKEQIVVTEIPYQVNPNRILERIAELVQEKKIEGIVNIRNESSREGMRLVIELKRDAMAQVVLNQLYNQTSLQITFSIMMLAIVEGQPRLLGLQEALRVFLEHRRVVVTRRTRFELAQAQARREVVEGLGLAIENIDRVIALIRAAQDPEAAKAALLAEPLPGLATFLERAGRPANEIAARVQNGVSYLTEPQVKAILDMRLQRLTGLERDKLLQEFIDLGKLSDQLSEILSNPERLNQVVVQELQALRAQFGDERRTEIVEQTGEINLESLIAEEPTVVTLSREGYVRRVSLSEYRSQRRGGRGAMGVGTKEEDLVHRIFSASTHDHVLLFTNKGRAYSKRVFELPEGSSRTSRGKAVVNVLNLQTDERLVEMMPLPNFDAGKYVVMATKNGVIKKTELDAFAHIRSNGLLALALDDGDALVGARITTGQMDLVLCTREGRVARFREESVRPLSRQARGVRGIRLRPQDMVVAMEVIDRDLPTTLLTVSERGYGKRTPAADYPLKGRGSKGVITIKTNERNGKVVGVWVIHNTDDLMLVTHDGTVIRLRAKSIPVQSRNTQGVRLIRLEKDARVVAAETLHEFEVAGATETADTEPSPEEAAIEVLEGQEELDDDTDDSSDEGEEEGA